MNTCLASSHGLFQLIFKFRFFVLFIHDVDERLDRLDRQKKINKISLVKENEHLPLLTSFNYKLNNRCKLWLRRKAKSETILNRPISRDFFRNQWEKIWKYRRHTLLLKEEIND